VRKGTEPVSDNLWFKKMWRCVPSKTPVKKKLYTTGKSLPTFYPSKTLETEVHKHDDTTERLIIHFAQTMHGSLLYCKSGSLLGQVIRDFPFAPMRRHQYLCGYTLFTSRRNLSRNLGSKLQGVYVLSQEGILTQGDTASCMFLWLLCWTTREAILWPVRH
jgi:hypothetical protein